MGTQYDKALNWANNVISQILFWNHILAKIRSVAIAKLWWECSIWEKRISMQYNNINHSLCIYFYRYKASSAIAVKMAFTRGHDYALSRSFPGQRFAEKLF